MNPEIEIKLLLGSFTDYLKLLGFLGPVDSEEHQINGYFDSEDRQLSGEGWALRVRDLQERGAVTLKGLPSQAGIAMVRRELEAEIPRPLATDVLNLKRDILSIEAAPIEFVKREFPGLSLARILKFSNIRQKKQFKIGDYLYLLEIDRTEYHDGSVDYELEVELNDASRVEIVEDGLRRVFTRLDIPFTTQVESKYERALAHANLR